MTELPKKKRIILNLILFMLTLVPVSSLNRWYQDALSKQGEEITGVVTHSAGKILNLFLNQAKPFLIFSARPLAFFLFKWGLVAGLLWWCATRIPKIKFLDRLKRIIFDSSQKRFQITLFAACLFLTCLLAYTVNDLQPDNPDSSAQLIQARIFASGNLYLPMPKEIDFFRFPFFFPKGDKWISLYNPGHTFLMMLGVLIGFPWLVNPLTGAGSVVLLYKIARKIYDEKTARLGALMLMLSPLFLFISSGHMNNATSLFFALLFIYFYINTLHTDKLIAPFVSGFFLGAVATVRPLTALMIGLFFGMYVIIKHKDISLVTTKCLRFAAGCAVTLSIMLTYNYLTNGKILRFNYSIYHRMLIPDVVTMGFGPSPWGVIHTPLRGLVHIWESLYQLNQQMFSWPVASMVLIFLFFTFSPKITGWDRLFLLTATGMIGVHFFFFVTRVRYFYAIIPLLILLCARGAIAFPNIIRSWNRKGLSVFIALFLTFCFSYAQIQQTLPALVKHPGRAKNRLPRLTARQNIHNAIIFTEGGYGGWGIYIYGFNYLNPILEENDVIYALDLEKRNNILAKRFPGRTTYRYIPNEGKIIPYDPYNNR